MIVRHTRKLNLLFVQVFNHFTNQKFKDLSIFNLRILGNFSSTRLYKYDYTNIICHFECRRFPV